MLELPDGYCVVSLRPIADISYLSGQDQGSLFSFVQFLRGQRLMESNCPLFVLLLFIKPTEAAEERATAFENFGMVPLLEKRPRSNYLLEIVNGETVFPRRFPYVISSAHGLQG